MKEKDEMVLEIYNRQKQGEPLKKLREEYGLSEGDYRHGRERLGLKALNRKNRLYTNDRFFDCIDSEIKAYYLGLLAADGTVVSEPGNTYHIAISLRDYDGYILEPFRDAVIPEREISSNSSKTGSNKSKGTVHILRFRNKKLGKALVDLGIKERKSFERGLDLPNIDPSLIPHFTRGFFDGDGHIVRTRRYSIKMGFVCKFPEILKSIQKYAHSQIELNFHSNLYLDRHERWYLDTSSQVGSLLLGSWLYANCNYKLERKYKKWKEFAQAFLQGEMKAKPYGNDNPVLNSLVKQAINVESRG